MRDDTAIHTAFEDHIQLDLAEPERNLMRAILRGAMEDTKKTGDLLRQASSYLMSEDRDYLFSFVSICNHLELCPKTIRKICGVRPNGYHGQSRQLTSNHNSA